MATQSTNQVSAQGSGTFTPPTEPVKEMEQSPFQLEIVLPVDIRQAKDRRTWFEFHAAQGTQMKFSWEAASGNPSHLHLKILAEGKRKPLVDYVTSDFGMAKVFQDLVNDYSAGMLKGDFVKGSHAGSGFARGRIGSAESEKIKTMHQAGTSLEEIAKAVNRPVETVKTHLEDMANANPQQ